MFPRSGLCTQSAPYGARGCHLSAASIHSDSGTCSRPRVKNVSGQTPFQEPRDELVAVGPVFRESCRFFVGHGSTRNALVDIHIVVDARNVVGDSCEL